MTEKDRLACIEDNIQRLINYGVKQFNADTTVSDYDNQIIIEIKNIQNLDFVNTYLNMSISGTVALGAKVTISKWDNNIKIIIEDYK